MYDFFIPYRSPQQNLEMVQKCKQLGYTTIAWTLTINADSQNLDEFLKNLLLVKVECSIEQYFRLHIVTGKANFSFLKIKCFDILSLEPTTLQAFHGACEYMPIDILTIPNNKIEIRDSCIKLAYDRHIRIEFLYGDTISNPALQRQFFNNLGFVARTRCRKRLLISCGSTELRKSMDTQAIFLICGFKAPEAVQATQNLKSLLLKFKTKQVHGGAIELVKKRGSDNEESVSKKIKTV